MTIYSFIVMYTDGSEGRSRYCGEHTESRQCGEHKGRRCEGGARDTGAHGQRSAPDGRCYQQRDVNLQVS